MAASICRNLAHSLAELRRGGRAEARQLQLLLECALGPDTVTNTEAELVLGAGLGLDTPQHRAQPGQAGKACYYKTHCHGIGSLGVVVSTLCLCQERM